VSYKFVSGDTGSTLRVTCLNDDDSAIINITGATVVLRWLNPTTNAYIEKTMTLITPLSGIADYQFLAGELIAPSMAFEVRITDGSGKIIRSLNPINVDVRTAFA